MGRHPESEWQDWTGAGWPSMPLDQLVFVEFDNKSRAGPRAVADWDWEHVPEKHPRRASNIVHLRIA